MSLMNFKPTSQKMKAAIYIRVSTAKQAKEGNGLEDQLNKCNAVLTMKDWELYKVYSNEKGISGTTEIKDRKELSDLLEDGKKGLFNCVVFNSLDRLGRTTQIILDVIETFTELNLKIVSCREFIDTTTASGELMLTFFAGIAQYEKRLIVERMAAGKAVVTAKYGERGGRLPIGYRRGDGGVLEINLAEAEIVKTIFKSRNEGLSLRQIAALLNALSIPTKRKGKQWYGSTVNSVLSNVKKYEGEKRNENENDVKWPRILFSDNENKAAIYIRKCFDTESLQLSKCEKRLERKELDLYKIYYDLNELMKDAAKRYFKYVVIDDVFRLGYELEDVTEKLDNFNIKIETNYEEYLKEGDDKKLI